MSRDLPLPLRGEESEVSRGRTRADAEKSSAHLVCLGLHVVEWLKMVVHAVAVGLAAVGEGPEWTEQREGAARARAREPPSWTPTSRLSTCTEKEAVQVARAQSPTQAVPPSPPDRRRPPGPSLLPASEHLLVATGRPGQLVSADDLAAKEGGIRGRTARTCSCETGRREGSVREPAGEEGTNERRKRETHISSVRAACVQ